MEEELRDDFLRWPRELVELKIASDLKEGSRIARLLRNSRQRLNDPELLAVFARNRAARLELVSQAEPVLGGSDLADVACSLHSTICEQLDVREPLLDAADDAARRSLLSGLDPAPRSKDEHRERAMALSRVSWLTVHQAYQALIGKCAAKQIHRGWIPLFERSARLLEQYAGRDDPGSWRTMYIKEKFGTLRWHVRGGHALWAAADIAMRTSSFSCIACGDEGELDRSSAWVLTLCPEHTVLRREQGGVYDVVYLNE